MSSNEPFSRARCGSLLENAISAFSKSSLRIMVELRSEFVKTVRVSGPYVDVFVFDLPNLKSCGCIG